MKWSVLILAATAMALAACNVKSSDDIKKKTDEIVRNAQQETAELTGSLYRGGQPGKITVNGIAVKKNGDQVQLDGRLKIEQIGGKGNRGVSQTQVSDKNKAVLSEVVDTKDFATVATSEKYINIGCEKLNDKEIENLTEQPIPDFKDAVFLFAKKIFICGSHPNAYSFLTIATEQLVLKNASIKVSALTGSISIAAMKISLEGINSVETQGLDLAASVLEAPPIALSLSDAIEGEGSLLLRSVGGNCVQEDEKK